jgi:hypothetical protein
MRVGYSGEQKGKPACYGDVLEETAGLMSPYPAGAKLPELDKRLSCAKLWPPVLAKADDKPIGKWTVVDRKDGTKQWGRSSINRRATCMADSPAAVAATRRRGVSQWVRHPKCRRAST